MRSAQTPVGNDVINSPVTAWKRKRLSPRCREVSFFLYVWVIPFSCQGYLEVSANLIVFFFFKFSLISFLNLFIRSLHVQRFVVWRYGWLNVFSRPGVLVIVAGATTIVSYNSTEFTIHMFLAPPTGYLWLSMISDDYTKSCSVNFCNLCSFTTEVLTSHKEQIVPIHRLLEFFVPLSGLLIIFVLILNYLMIF